MTDEQKKDWEKDLRLLLECEDLDEKSEDKITSKVKDILSTQHQEDMKKVREMVESLRPQRNLTGSFHGIAFVDGKEYEIRNQVIDDLLSQLEDSDI